MRHARELLLLGLALLAANVVAAPISANPSPAQIPNASVSKILVAFSSNPGFVTADRIDFSTGLHPVSSHLPSIAALLAEYSASYSRQLFAGTGLRNVYELAIRGDASLAIAEFMKDRNVIYARLSDPDLESKVAETVEKINSQTGGIWIAGYTIPGIMTPEDKRKLLGSSSLPARVDQKSPAQRSLDARFAAIHKSLAAGQVPSPPNSFDWRNYNNTNYITPVKNQGSCGSCWAFVTTGSVQDEANAYYNSNLGLNLSEQQLLSCSGAGNCEQGGALDGALGFVQSTGLVSEACFPYAGTDSVACSAMCSNPTYWKISPSGWLPDILVGEGAGSVDDLDIQIALLAYGPYSTDLEVYSDFPYYVSGIYYPTSGAVPIALHAAVVVGYGFAAPPPALNSGSSSVLYMAMKNSWGTSWGENGFFDIYSGVVGDNESMIGVDAPVPPTPAAQVAMCQDLDGAGHCYWGLGSKPQSGCPSTCTSSAEYCAYSGPTQAPAVCLTSASIIPPTPTVTVTPASSSITPAQSLPVTVSVGSVGPTPTGSVTLTGGNYVSAATPLSSGSATFNLPAGSLTPSLCTVNYTLVADYAPDSNSSSIYSIAGGTTNVTVIPPASLALYPWPATLSVNQGSSSTDDIAVAGDCGYSGTVTLSASGLPSGVAASFNPNAFSLTSDYMSVLTLTASASAAVTSSPVTVTITGTSGSQTPSTTIALTVNAAPTFAIAAGTSSLSIAPGATTGNTVAITVTPSNGFTGTVNLTCGVTPVAASDPPTCSLLPGSVTIAGTGAQSSTLTISTTAATSAKSEFKKLLWPSAGTALALLLMGVPRRRRNWLPLLGILALAVTFGVIGCGGGGGNSGGGGGGGNSGGGGGGNTGTTPGTYTVTVTGASGNITGTVGTVTLTVQ